MRPVLFALPLLAATVGFAQTQTAAYTPPGPPFMINGWKCPATMSAQQQGTEAMRWVIALEDASGTVSQRGRAGIHIDLKMPEEKAISTVQLAVRYLAPGVRFMPVTEKAKANHDLSKTYQVKAADGARMIDASLLVGPAATVTWVDLLSVTYADGSVWHPAPADHCSVKPSLFVPVSAR